MSEEESKPAKSEPRPRPKRTLKDRIGDVVFETSEGWPQRFDSAILVIIVLSVIAVMLESVSRLQLRYGRILLYAEYGFTLLFTIEYAIRIWVARKRRRYVFSFFGIVDLLSLLPTYISFVFGTGASLLIIRILRLLRLFRVLKLVRMSKEARSLGYALQGSAAKIIVFLGTVVILAILIGSIIHLIEGAEAGFTSIPVSVYWAVVTLTTVGYGDIHPITPLGQTLAAMLMIMGYGIIAVPTGIVSAELVAARKVRRLCLTCPVTDHTADATFCRACGSVLELGRAPPPTDDDEDDS